MPLYGKYQTKPPLGAPIAWSAPLAQGLRGFFAINEGAGTTLYDAAGISPAIPFLGSPSWASGSAGTMLACNVAGYGAKVALPPVLQPPWPVSVAFGFRLLGNLSGSNGRPWGCAYNINSVGIAPYIDWGFTWSTNAPLLFWASGTTAQSLAMGAAMSVGDHVLSGAITASAQTGYRDGVRYSQASAISSPAYTASSGLTIGTADATNGNVAPYWCAWWNRALTDQEQSAIAASPSAIFGQVFGSPRSYFLMRAAAAAPGAHYLPLLGCGG